MSEKGLKEIAARFKYAAFGILIFIRDGFKNIVTGPLKWGWRQWAVAALFVFSLVSAYIWKRPLQCFFGGDDSGIPEFFADIAKHGGDFPMPLCIGFILAIVGCISGKKNWIDSGAALLASAAVAGIFTVLGQFILAEQRPYQGGELGFFRMDGHGVSGHATASALLLWPIMKILLQNAKKIVRAIGYTLLIGWPCLVAWSRMWDDKHYLWNVMLGLAIGFSSSYAVVKSREKQTNI